MGIGDLVWTEIGHVGVVVRPYRQPILSAWVIDLWNPMSKRLIEVAKWEKDLTVLEGL